MKKQLETYQVTIALTTVSSVFVDAGSAQEAKQAVRRDFESGGESLCDWIIAVEKTIPFSDSKVLSANKVRNEDRNSSFYVDSKGNLIKRPDVVIA